MQLAAGGGQRSRQNRGDRVSRGAKDARPKEVAPAFLKTWIAEQTKKMDASLAAMAKALGQHGEGPANKQGE